MPNSSLLTRSEIEQALRLLGKQAHGEGKELQIMVVGGTAMVLGFDARPSTKDIDYAVLPPTDSAYVRNLGLRVAQQLGWNDDWLNDGAKGFLHTQSAGPMVFESEGIQVIRPTTAQLLAMKLIAWRDDVDIHDAELLLASLDAKSADDVWQELVPFVIPGYELKAHYALDDLWQHRS
jgi:hypothetical protein